MDEWTIRPLRAEDRAAVREICLRTAGIAVKTPAQRAFLWTMYSDCYTGEYPDFCFVAADRSGRPVGYILCAPGYKDYLTAFRRSYLPQLKRISLYQWFRAGAEARWMRPFAGRGYPAHMHIDLLEEARHRGVGTQLFQALCARLRAEGIPGLCLGVGAENRNAIAFYRKMGFLPLRRAGGSLVMGIRL